MAKVGRFVVDPGAGACCQITLSSGEKITVNHDKGGFKGGHVFIERSKWWSSERFFELDLDSAQGKAVMATLTRGAAAGSVDATPLGAFVNHVKDATSIEDVRARCARLVGEAHAAS